MRLKAFKIKNFRSIISTNWNNLSNDNITGLIGQNESGKTSVLESLMCFYDSKITDDMLRSDLSLPEISCRFEFEKGLIAKVIDLKRLPKELVSLVSEFETLDFTRKWNVDKSSEIFVSEKSINEYYENIKQRKKQKEVEVDEKISEILKEYTIISEKRAEFDTQKITLESKQSNLSEQITSLERNIRRTRRENLKKEYQEELNPIKAEYKKNIERLNLIKNNILGIEKEQNTKSSIASIAIEVDSIKNIYKSSLQEKEEALSSLKELEQSFNLASNANERKIIHQQLDEARITYNEINEKVSRNFLKLKKQKLITEKIFEGSDTQIAKEEAESELNKELEIYSPESLGRELFKLVPTFEFFEDFSSLLPNRIDLDDILKDNTSIEGYKAAKNFLMIAGLDASFFEEKNNRILKQKIEKLNNDLTVNFRDYWRQKVGKDNRININFELEHYDFTHPEKSGKPYLEFWIKDKNERLYPKQRSRGVRWFLSFYLELKASATEGAKNKILLIDEPGLSLHARAQEDVLKVFEDLKEQMQILYSTHSPHLINVNKLYRLLAVQRADEDDFLSETKILDSRSLDEASTDTLSPIYALMGTKLNDQQYIQGKNNIIVEDIASYYYYSAFAMLKKPGYQMYFLPSTDVANVAVMANLLMGWKIHYVMVLDDDFEGNMVYEKFKKDMYFNDSELVKKYVLKMDGIHGAEDILSTIDFKKYVLKKRVGITELNSEYVRNNDLSGSVLASAFLREVQENNLALKDFDEETQENINVFVEALLKMMV